MTIRYQLIINPSWESTMNQQINNLSIILFFVSALWALTPQDAGVLYTHNGDTTVPQLQAQVFLGNFRARNMKIYKDVVVVAGTGVDETQGSYVAKVYLFNNRGEQIMELPIPPAEGERGSAKCAILNDRVLTISGYYQLDDLIKGNVSLKPYKKGEDIISSEMLVVDERIFLFEEIENSSGLFSITLIDSKFQSLFNVKRNIMARPNASEKYTVIVSRKDKATLLECFENSTGNVVYNAPIELEDEEFFTSRVIDSILYYSNGPEIVSYNLSSHKTEKRNCRGIAVFIDSTMLWSSTDSLEEQVFLNYGSMTETRWSIQVPVGIHSHFPLVQNNGDKLLVAGEEYMMILNKANGNVEWLNVRDESVKKIQGNRIYVQSENEFRLYELGVPAKKSLFKESIITYKQPWRFIDIIENNGKREYVFLNQYEKNEELEKNYGAIGNLYSFEPESNTFSFLCPNVEVPEYRNIDIYNGNIYFDSHNDNIIAFEKGTYKGKNIVDDFERKDSVDHGMWLEHRGKYLTFYNFKTKQFITYNRKGKIISKSASWNPTHGIKIVTDSTLLFTNDSIDVLLDLKSGKELTFLPRYMSMNAFKQKDNLLIGFGMDTIKVVDIKSGKIKGSIYLDANRITRVQIYKDQFYVVDGYNRIHAYDLKSLEKLWSFETKSQQYGPQLFITEKSILCEGQKGLYIFDKKSRELSGFYKIEGYILRKVGDELLLRYNNGITILDISTL